MTKMEYAQAVANGFENARVTEVTKDNGVVMTGVIVDMGDISPTCYIDSYYERGTEVAEVIDGIKGQLSIEMPNPDEFDWVSDWNKVKKNIKVKLMNKAANKHVEVYRSAKNYGFSDLIIAPYVTNLNVCGRTGNIMITNIMIENWGVTKRTVIDWGIKNIGVEVMPLARKLAKMMGGTEEMFDSPFTIVSTGAEKYGAVGIIKAREELMRMHPNGYVVIPSSVHEMLVLPVEQAVDTALLEGLIGEVNTDMLAETEVLSDHPYMFDVVA